MSNTLRKNIIKASIEPRIRFTHDGNTCDDYVIDVPLIRRDVNLSTGTTTITVNNRSGNWNFLHTTHYQMNKAAEVKLYLSGDTTNMVTILSGKVQRAKFEGTRCVLTIRDAMGDLLNKKLGSGNSPISYNAKDWPADEMVWHILTNRCGLDDLVGISQAKQSGRYC